MRHSDDGLEIPKFLRASRRDAEARKRRNIEWARAHPTSTSPVEVGSEREALLKDLRLLHPMAPAHWLDDPETLLKIADKKREIEHRKQEREKRRQERDPLRGLTPLKKILEWANEDRVARGATPLKRRHALAAIDAAKIYHRKYRFDDVYVQDARRVVASHEPPVKARRAGGRERPSADGASVIRALVKSNPCRPGTGRHARVTLLLAHAGGTVAAYLAAGGALGTLLKSAEFGWVKIVSAEAGEQPVEKKTSKRRKKS